jgi:transposase
MAKKFRPWDVDQRWLFPPSVQELMPEGHLSHFVRDTVRELDLSAIFDVYDEERGFPPYHPAMMTAVLLYAYCQGVYSSRRIAKACLERIDFMSVTAAQKPDFRTVSDFRKRHLSALGRLFRQVLELCRKAQMVKLGHVALDGTKLKANASKHKAMSYGRMKEAEPRLAAEVQSWFDRAGSIDREEDAEFGVDKTGDELPDWVVNKATRQAKIREAMAALEAEAAAEPPDDKPEPPTGKGKKPKPEPRKPDDKRQRNFTDPESKLLKTKDGFIQGYNCQVAVDAEAQVIVAHEVKAKQSDAEECVAMVDQIRANVGRSVREISADAGYLSEANLRALRRRRVNAYIATGRQRRGMPLQRRRREGQGPLTRAMREKLARGGHRSRYRLRKQVVEPVFGQIKHARCFDRFSLRGRAAVADEWAIICTAHNLLKLALRIGRTGRVAPRRGLPRRSGGARRVSKNHVSAKGSSASGS